jgi:hypothetical protein
LRYYSSPADSQYGGDVVQHVKEIIAVRAHGLKFEQPGAAYFAAFTPRAGAILRQDRLKHNDVVFGVGSNCEELIYRTAARQR